MDVMQTLDVVDGPYEEEDSCDDDEGVWEWKDSTILNYLASPVNKS